MCSIFGWFGVVTTDEKLYIIDHASERGRDGCGFWIDGRELRTLTSLIGTEKYIIISGDCILGNFRATPTTETESKVELLQPYDGIIHNGTIANDKEFSNELIDSMVLPSILKNRKWSALPKELEKLKGSYALAYFYNDELMLARNYKPIYFIKKDRGFMFASTPDMLPDYSIPVPPYSVMKIDRNIRIETEELKRHQSNKVLVSASSGLDSTTVAYMLKDQGYDVTLAYLSYNCLAEVKELNAVHDIADHGGFDLEIIPMPTSIMKGTIVEGTYHKDQIEGVEYAEDWVSARNLLMLAILTAYAESNDFGYISFGGNLEESSSYPDNEQEFGRKFNEILPYATQNGIKIELLQPLSTYMKHEIVKIGMDLGVPYELTWSCYSGLEKHCDNCAPCYMRKVAFERNGLKDLVFI